MKAPKPLPRISKKRRAALGDRRIYSTVSAPKKPIKKKARSKSEFARIYHSKARVEFVKSLPCAACGVVGYSENAHLLGNGGMGRKAGYETIGPLCGIHTESLAGFWPTTVSCHAAFDQFRPEFEYRFPLFDPLQVATDTQAAWISFTDRSGQ